MHKVAFSAVALLTVAGQANAQQAPAPAPPPAPTCPANGYAQPYFGFFGDNDGVLRGYEIASPCNGKEVRDAAEAIGMGRNKPLGVKNVTTIRFQATGKFADDRGRLQDVSSIDMSLSYVVPGARIVVQRAAASGPVTEVRVFADGMAWNETSPGVGLTPAQAQLASRAALLKLTPFGALWSVIEAEGHATVSTVNGRKVIAGTSPYDHYPVTVTLDDQNRPVAMQMKAEGKSYAATFEGYTDKWESPYLVIFPEHITWTMNGKPLADLHVTGFHSNPYVVFPPPAPGPTRPH